MIPVLFALTLCQHPPDSEWQQAVNKIAPYLVGYKVSADRKVNDRQFEGVLRKAGFTIWEDNNPDEKQPTGYCLDYRSDPLSVGGTDDLIIRIQRSSGADRYQGSVISYFARRGQSCKAIGFSPDPFDLDSRKMQSMRIEHASRSGGFLLTSGLAYWYSNAPCPSLVLWRLKNGAWRPVSQMVAEVESDESPRIANVGNDRFNIEPIRGRTYPYNLDTCHATSLQTWTQKVELRGTKLFSVYRRLDMTPYNQLDRLYGALSKGSVATVRTLCVDAKIAKQVMALRPRTSEPVSEVHFPKNVPDPNSRKIAVENLRVWFHFTKKNGKWVVAKLTPYQEPGN